MQHSMILSMSVEVASYLHVIGDRENESEGHKNIFKVRPVPQDDLRPVKITLMLGGT